MKILVLCENYSSVGAVYRMAWVHTRNIEYSKNGHDITVLNFNSVDDYIYEGIKVKTKKTVGYNLKDFDLILSHAPNIKSHFFFLLRAKFRKIIFFFHGHEILYTEIDYPETYSYNKKSVLKKYLRNTYDFLKIKLIRWLSHSFLKEKAYFVFVSDWMKDQYEKNTGVSLNVNSFSCIPNPVWHEFVARSHSPELDSSRLKVLTLRKLDESKYAVDIVLEVARANPDIDFYVYGKGSFFEHYQKPVNVHHESKLIEQKNLATFLNGFHLALLPTRYDSQGVLGCEIATYGMPLISSKIPVIEEMLNRFPHVYLMDNSNPRIINIETVYDDLKNNIQRNNYFSPVNTVSKELQAFERFVNE